ncbi:hypothetical protein Psal006b_02214 [Piscirickettsia salmonis]|uniref:Lipoprotein n=1 Tax=Piscirickettsia salmonis TaxID=1238 RepID=A0AAC8VGK6_PISSA|nr:hypothetical protein KU39_994 [Piscirickettsia salmonis]QGN99212.1 hypothetical protein Psal006b_02214 [Piscirickettsia salmonis]QGO02841.1 hypothetical protein Psal008_02232 [Piscirickettsia salmonis]QGO13509.1 hypothetical protein Psal010b_02211 [Piscirickettsia salmonis]QGO20581.1 hypothetical protein Psal013_02243 [Piscirickettsia salmonis]
MKRTCLRALLAAACVVLVGCSSLTHHDQQSTQSTSSVDKGHSVQSLQKGSAAATLGKGK